MNAEDKYLPVNWVDGMKITKEHLNGLENSFWDSIRHSIGIGLTGYNYGLLPPAEVGREPFGVDVNSNFVEVIKCQAVTQGGMVIEVLDDSYPSLKKPFTELLGARNLSESTEWYVVIKINPYKKIPFGVPNPEETPLRHPHTRPDYQLELIPADRVYSTQMAFSAVPIARIINNHQGAQLDQSYIPPCTRTGNIRSMLDKYIEFKRKLDEIDRYLVDISKKIVFKRNTKNNNQLSDDIGLLAGAISNHINQNIDAYRLTLESMPPVFLVEWFARMARLMLSTSRLMNSEDSMLAYFDSYIGGSRPAKFKSILENMANVSYDHLNIRASLTVIDNFLGFLEEVFRKLKDLDYQKLADPSIVTSTITSGHTISQPTQPANPASGSGPVIIIKTTGDKTAPPGQESNRSLLDDLVDD